MAVASSHRSNNWEGSAWDDAGRVPFPDRLRYALITPRIVAPHLNREPNTVGPEEAIASLMLCRFDAIETYESRGCMPGADARQMGGWPWMFFDALRQYIQSGELNKLRDRIKDASRPHESSAAGALLLACMIEQGQANEVPAVAVAEADDPVDRDWVRIQQARALYELGELSRCSEIALSVAALRATHPDDPTAQAFAAAALNLLFEIGWSRDHFEPMVRTNDNAPAWWRAQQRAWGLGAVLAHSYEQWSGLQSSAAKLRAASLRLRSVALTSGASGDSAAWRQATSELAKLDLSMSGPDTAVAQYTAALRRLCLAGDAKTTKSAAKRLVADGPLEAARIAAREVNLVRATRSSVKSSIALVASAAEVVEPEHADRHVSWALRVLADPGPVRHLAVSTAWLQRELVEMTRHLWPSMTTDGHKQVVSFLSSMGPVPEQLVAHEYARLISRVEQEDWEPAAIEAIAKRIEGFAAFASRESQGPSIKQPRPETTPFGDNWELGDAWRGLLAATGDTRERTELIHEATRGDDRALLALDDLAAVPPDDAAKIIGRLDEALRLAQSRAAAGVVTFGGVNYGQALVHMNLIFPQHAHWEPVYALLELPHFPDQVGALEVLASRSGSVPDAVVRELLPRLERLAERKSPPLLDLLSPVKVSDLAKRVLAAIRPQEVEMVDLARTLATRRDGRQQVARSVGAHPSEAGVALLAALAYDPDPVVTELAAHGIARALASGVATDVSSTVLQGLLTSTGTRNAKAIAVGLARPEASADARALLHTLADHPSAQVREFVLRYIPIVDDVD